MVNDDRPLFHDVDELERQLEGKPDKDPDLPQDDSPDSVGVVLRTPMNVADPARDDDAADAAEPNDR